VVALLRRVFAEDLRWPGGKLAFGVLPVAALLAPSGFSGGVAAAKFLEAVGSAVRHSD
jgi:hypothetical protein